MGQKDFTKINPAEVEWPVLYRVVSACGNSHNPRSFAIDILDNVASLCPFDQALVYFLDANHKLLGYYLKGIDEKYNREYLEYYAESMGHYDEFARVRENPNQPTINVRDWKKEKPSAFLRDYIQMRGLRYSVGFALYDLNANIRTVVALDRLKECPFTNRELYGLQLFVNIINQMHKNFYYQGNGLRNIRQATWQEARLTAREIEVVDLLVQGVSPSNIGKILYISQSTTYKHIAHIYEKMGVSSQQELLVKLLRKTE